MGATFSPGQVWIATLNPLSAPDHGVAAWFHNHLTHGFVALLRLFSDFGDAESIGIIVGCVALFFAWKRWWQLLVTLIVVVPGGMLLNEWLKVLVHRHRPFVDGWFVDWSGYSFASGHTIGATLLYGQLALFVVPTIKSRRWRGAIITTAIFFVLIVGFSRIALGAHYLSDVLAAVSMSALWLTICLLVARRFGPRQPLRPDFSGASALAPIEVTRTPEAILSPNE